MNNDILENIKFKAGRGFLAALPISKVKTNRGSYLYNKTNELTTLLPQRDYFLIQTGFGDANYFTKLFRFETVTVFKFNDDSFSDELAFLKLENTDLGAVVFNAALESLKKLFNEPTVETRLYANVSSLPFVMTDNNNIAFGLVFPVREGWIATETFYNCSRIDIISQLSLINPKLTLKPKKKQFSGQIK